MFRSSFKSISKIRASVPSRILFNGNKGPISSICINKRNYATEPDVKASQILGDLTKKIQSSPGVMESLTNVQNIMIEKGVNIKSGSLSASDYFTIFKDSEIRESFKKFSQEMEKADIKIDPTQIESLMKVLGLNK